MKETVTTKKSSPAAPEIQKKRKKITQSYLENAGAYYLERFSASIAQFCRIMGQKIEKSCKDHPDQNREECLTLLDAVVKKFIDLGYLNDTVYARSLYNTLLLRGFSRTRILGTLRMKGLTQESIDSVIPEPTIEQEKESALRWAKKKRLGPFALRVRDNDLQRGLGSLARAGFGYDIASWVMKLSPNEAQDLL